MKTFSFYHTRALHYGPGSLDKLGEEIVNFRAARPLIVTDPGVIKAGIIGKVEQHLRGLAVDYCIFSDVEADPTVNNVQEAFLAYRRENCDLVIGIGGGSALDAAKMAAVLATGGGSVHDYIGPDKIQNDPAPLIAVPTTAGTGSEVTSFAVVRDEEQRYKMTAFSFKLVPPVVIDDPLLTMTLPPHLTAYTGMDALCHAIESYINVIEQPLSEIFATRAINMLAANLPPAVARGDINIEARHNMLLGSTLAGIAFCQTGVTVLHSMSHPLSAHFRVQHGLANALLLPYVLRFNLQGCAGKYAQVAALIGQKTDGLSTRDAAEALINGIERLNADLGIPPTLGSLGIDESHLPLLAEDTMKSGNIPKNPRLIIYDQVLQIYRDAL